MDKRFERLKSELFRGGLENIEDFLGYEINPEEDKDVMENRMDEVYAQMPEEELEKFYAKFHILDKEAALRFVIPFMQRERISLTDISEELNYRERAGVKDGHAGWDDGLIDYSTEELEVIEAAWSEMEKTEDKVLVAIESTDDYSNAEFHSRLVDLDVQNADGTYGKMVDYYRIVHIGEAGGIVRLDERVFERAEEAREAVLGDGRLELVKYDDLVHEAVWQLQHGSKMGSVEDVIAGAERRSCAFEETREGLGTRDSELGIRDGIGEFTNSSII